jgi:hypothetical protein
VRFRLDVMASAGQNGRGVIAIACPIPQKQRAHDIAFGGGKFRGQDAAADFEPQGGIAERSKRRAREAMLPRHLAHHLHQSPGKCAGARFGDVGDDAARNLGRNVLFVERRLITQRPGIPRGLLFDDGADQLRPKRMRFGRGVRERSELCGRRQRVHLLAAGLAAVWIGFLAAIQVEETNRRRIIDLDAMMRGDAPQNVIDVRQMIKSYVADEGAFNGGIAQTPMQPAEENTELREQRKGNDQPIGVHGCGPQTSLATSS